MPDLLLKGVSVALNRVVFRVEHEGVIHRVMLPRVLIEDLDRTNYTSQGAVAVAFARHRPLILERTLAALRSGCRGDDTFTLFLGIADFPEATRSMRRPDSLR